MNYQSDLLYPATLHARSMTRLFNRQFQFHGKFTPSVLSTYYHIIFKNYKNFPSWCKCSNYHLDYCQTKERKSVSKALLTLYKLDIKGHGHLLTIIQIWSLNIFLQFCQIMEYKTNIYLQWIDKLFYCYQKIWNLLGF